MIATNILLPILQRIRLLWITGYLQRQKEIMNPRSTHSLRNKLNWTLCSTRFEFTMLLGNFRSSCFKPIQYKKKKKKNYLVRCIITEAIRNIPVWLWLASQKLIKHFLFIYFFFYHCRLAIISIISFETG